MTDSPEQKETAPPLSDEEIAELRRLSDTAIPAPWAWEPTGDKDNSWGVGIVEDEEGAHQFG